MIHCGYVVRSLGGRRFQLETPFIPVVGQLMRDLIRQPEKTDIVDCYDEEGIRVGVHLLHLSAAKIGAKQVYYEPDEHYEMIRLYTEITGG